MAKVMPIWFGISFDKIRSLPRACNSAGLFSARGPWGVRAQNLDHKHGSGSFNRGHSENHQMTQGGADFGLESANLLFDTNSTNTNLQLRLLFLVPKHAGHGEFAVVFSHQTFGLEPGIRSDVDECLSGQVRPVHPPFAYSRPPFLHIRH